MSNLGSLYYYLHLLFINELSQAAAFKQYLWIFRREFIFNIYNTFFYKLPGYCTREYCFTLQSIYMYSLISSN